MPPAASLASRTQARLPLNHLQDGAELFIDEFGDENP